MFIEGKVLEEVSVVSKRASGSAFLDGAEGFKEQFGLDSENCASFVLGF